MMLSRETRFLGPRRVLVIRHGCTALNAESGETDRIRGWAEGGTDVFAYIKHEDNPNAPLIALEFAKAF